MSQDMKAVDPRQLALRSPREEFLELVSNRIMRLQGEGEDEKIQELEDAKVLGASWLPKRPGGESA